MMRLLGAGLVLAVGARLRAEDRIGTASTDRPWQWQSYAAPAGLLRQRVFDLAFARDGTAWLAASNGLWRYDGYHWTSFGPDDGLPSRFVRAVLMTQAGELWVGTDAGAGVFDPVHRSFDPRGGGGGLPNDNVRQIVEDPDGTLWFCCDQWPDTSIGPGGLASRTPDGHWRVFTQADGLPMNYIIGYHRDRAGRQFALTPRGWVWRGEAGRWLPPEEAGHDQEAMVLHLAEAGDGRLFAQGEQNLLTLDQGRWHPLAAKTLLVGGTREGEVLGLVRDRQRGTLWMARWNGADFVPVSARIPGPRVARFYHLREAPDGAIWCVGEGTILRWAPKRAAWSHFARLPPPQTVDALDRVWFAGAGEVWWAKGGVLHRLEALADFVGVERDGAVLGRAPDGTLVQIRDVLHPVPEPVELEIGSLQAATDFDQALWVWGQDAAGHTRFAHRDAGGRWRTFGSPRLQNQRIVSVHPDPRGGIDVVFLNPRTTQYEIARVAGDTLEWIDLGAVPPPIPYPQFYRVGTVEFISGYDHVYQRDTAAGEGWSRAGALNAGAFTQALTSGSEAFLLFNGGKVGAPGVARFRDGRWRIVPGEFDHAAFSQDRRRLSIATRGGIYRQAAPGVLDFDYLPLPEDVPVQTLIETSTGELWLNTSDGVLHYQPVRQAPETTIVSQLTEVRGNGLPVRFGGIGRHQAPGPAEAWRFSWRFDGGTWSAFGEGGERTLPVGLLSPGPHTVEVRARDADGEIDPSPARLGFQVPPVPLQERAWFPYVLTGLALLIAWLLWLGIARSRAIRRSNAALLREIDERHQAEAALRVARDQLERRVAERTVELSTTNASLRQALVEQAAAEGHRARLEQQLREAQKMQAIGTLAGGIAHDFNNILTVIIPCAQLGVEADEAPSAVRKHLTLILEAASRAKLLVQQILAFSRRQPNEFSVIDLKPIVKETRNLLASALPADVEMRCEIMPRTPTVLADPTQMHQVLMNLCTNAEHALRGRADGRIVIRLDALEVDESAAQLDPALRVGRYVRLSVRDNGAGMTEGVRRRAFEPFFTTKMPGHGTGLGLAVVHGIVQEHDGVIRIESQPGAGTLVEVLLPARTGATPLSRAPAARPPRGLGETILLVDDIPAVLETLGSLLRHNGYQVVAHGQAAAALEAFRAAPERFDLVVTDFTMPGMNGLELCREIRRERSELPLILITGFDGNVPSEDLASAGVDAIVVKPFDDAVFFGRIRDLLHARVSR